MRYCKKCGLPENYQGIHLDEADICNFCHFYDDNRERLEDYSGLEKQFEDEIELAKQEAKKNHAKYDCVTGLSGGKDGAYITWMLQHKYGMRVLTYTLDNGFSTDFGRKNVDILVNKLDVDHMWIHVKDSELRKFYSSSMKLLKNFCSVCFHFCHYYSHLLAGQFGIPLVVNGRTRSQILQSAGKKDWVEPFHVSRNLKDFEYQMFGKLVDKLDGYSCIDFLKDREVTSLSYFMYHDVTDEEKMDFLVENIGWIRPQINIPHPDCWAHPMAEYYSIQKHDYPVRTGELAEMVREGRITLQNAEDEKKTDYVSYHEVSEEIKKRFSERICKR